MSDDSEHSEDEGPTEAELALKKRREPEITGSKGLDEAARELLETNRQDRERMQQEIQELKKRNEKRKKLRQEEEKRLAAERAADEEKRKAAENAKQKQKEEEEMKRQKERAKKADEFAKYQNLAKPNFVISKRSGSTGDDEEVTESSAGNKKSREQLEAEKRAIMKQRIVPLEINGLDQSGLTDKAKELHKLIYRLEGEKYDLEKRFKTQQVDMMELAERARQANKVGRDGLKRAQIGEDETDKIQERFAGTPAKILMFSKYERQKDMRNYGERKTTYTGPQYIFPTNRIQPNKIVKWNEAGMPTYEEMAETGAAPPAEHTEE